MQQGHDTHSPSLPPCGPRAGQVPPNHNDIMEAHKNSLNLIQNVEHTCNKVAAEKC